MGFHAPAPEVDGTEYGTFQCVSRFRLHVKGLPFTEINSVHLSYHHHYPEKYWISFFLSNLLLARSDPCHHHHHHPDRPQIVAPRQGRGHPHLQRQELCFQVHR